jgi:hypothetical protein
MNHQQRRRKGLYVAMAKMLKTSKDKRITKETKIYIDSWEEDSCYGRYMNDPLNDHLVNVRIVMRGDKMVLIALEEIRDIHKLLWRRILGGPSTFVTNYCKRRSD